MEAFISAMNTVFSTFGSVVIVPVILFVIGRFMGLDNAKAFRSALLAAVGLAGFSLVINSYSGIVAPVVNQMVENAGVNLPALDTGWQSTSVIAYSSTVGILFIGVAIALELILFFARWTDVFMASDLWNNYSFMVWGSLIYALTGDMWLAMACMVTQLLYILLFSEVMAKRWSTYYQYPQCCMTAPHHLESTPYALGMNWLLSKIGMNRIRLDANSIQKKLGIFGEPMFIGLIVGLIIGILGNFNVLAELSSWGTITSVAVNTAAIMAIFPKVGGIFASAFTAMTDAYKAKAAKSGAGRDWYLSINDAAGYGEPNTLVTGTLLIPVMLGLSFVLPGNTILPMADLCALPYMVEVFVASSNGNVAKSLVMGAIWFGLGLIVASQLAPTFTEVAISTGFQLPQEGVYIMSFGIMCHPLIAAIFYAFWSQNPLIFGLVIALYFVLYFLFKKNKATVVDWVEESALISTGAEVSAA